MAETQGQLDLNLPGSFVTLDVRDHLKASASAAIVDTEGEALDFDTGTILIKGSLDGYSWPKTFATLTDAGGVEPFDCSAYQFVRAEVGTAASNRVIVQVTLSATDNG